MTLGERFKKFEDSVETDYTASRQDLKAFNLIAQLLPDAEGGDIVSCAEHDVIWLNVEPEDLNEVITDEQIQTLIQCGVMYDDDVDSLSMFV